ncbi:MAG: arginine--tRNA ligase [bacterium]|nr:arginine--tRNA ligase [bacterium]
MILKKYLADRILDALVKINIQCTEVVVDRTQSPDFGHYTSSVSFNLSRVLKKSPYEIAKNIVENLTDPLEFINKVEIRNGFINFFLKENAFGLVIKEIMKERANYGKFNEGQGKKVQIEFVSANPSGPLHVGNGRGGALGDVLANIFEWFGYKVEREFYVNDMGTQMNLLALSVEARMKELLGMPFEFPEDGYHGEYIKDIANLAIGRFGSDIWNLPQEKRLERLKEFAKDTILEWQRRDLEDFGIRFDCWYKESTLHEKGLLKEAFEILKACGYTYEKDGAVWFASTRFGDEKDRVLVKSDGSSTYFLADIAYHLDKYRRGFSRIIDIWGADHHGHIPRMKASVKALGYDPNTLELIIYQIVHLFRGGSAVRMSKRAGEMVTLRELLDEVGKDAARYFFIMRDPNSQLDFDIDLAKAQSSNNPVYYVQYAFARCCSLFRQAEAREVEIERVFNCDLSYLKDPLEVDLMIILEDFPDMLRNAFYNRAPHRLTFYLESLAKSFHSFYNSLRILQEEEPVMYARMALVFATQQVIKNGLDIIGVSTPEKM